MDYQKERTPFGRKMYTLVYNWAVWLDKRPWLYYFLLLTWGCVESLMGLSVALVMILSGHKPKKAHRGFYFVCGDNWGGFSISFISVIANEMGEEYTKRTIAHECGHSYQVALLGIFWIFLVGIPSQLRYLRNEICVRRYLKVPCYDLIWFEGEATDSGKFLSYGE